MALAPLAQLDGIRVAGEGRLLVVYMSKPLQPDGLELFHHLLLQRPGRHLALFVTALGVTPNVSKEMRARSLERRRSIEERLTGAAVVVRDGGIGLSVVQLFLAAYTLLIPIPLRLFNDLGEGLTWLHQLPGQGPQLDSLGAASILEYFGEPT